MANPRHTCHLEDIMDTVAYAAACAVVLPVFIYLAWRAKWGEILGDQRW